MNKEAVTDIEVTGKRVLVRVDFNVPIDAKTGVITDDGRIRAALPTINNLVARGARVILASHLGRPDGRVVDAMRMAPVARRLSELTGKPVATTSDCIGPKVEKAAAKLKNSELLLIENLRFHAEEESNDRDFAGALARLADIYVDDAFGTAHRKHASIVGVARYLPSVAGLLLQKELDNLGGLLENPAHPFSALLGGAKISDKVAMLQQIMRKVDRILVGGAMAATFLKAKGLEIGQSLVENDRLPTASKLMEDARKNGINLILPVDAVVAERIAEDAATEVVAVDRIAPAMRIADIGPQTIHLFEEQLKGSRTVFWNGPMGVYEVPKFGAGTRSLARTLAGLNASTVIGGGSTADVVAELGLEDKMTFVSTGGGASLSFLSGESLPGVDALMDKA